MAVHQKVVAGLPLDRFADRSVVVEGTQDAEIYARVPELIRTHRPGFAFVHLVDIDEAAHAHGPYTAEVKRVASEMDRYLEGLLACFAEAGYALLALADHGMYEIPGGDREGHLGNHDGSVEEDRVVSLLWTSAEELQEVVKGEGMR